jgi:hypothetical protein
MSRQELRMDAYKSLLMLFTGRRRSCSRSRGDSRGRARRVGNIWSHVEWSGAIIDARQRNGQIQEILRTCLGDVDSKVVSKEKVRSGRAKAMFGLSLARKQRQEMPHSTTRPARVNEADGIGIKRCNVCAADNGCPGR